MFINICTIYIQTRMSVLPQWACKSPWCPIVQTGRAMHNYKLGLLHYRYVSNKTLWQVCVQGALYGNKEYAWV